MNWPDIKMPKLTIFEGTMDEVINYSRFVNKPYRTDENGRGNYHQNRRGKKYGSNPNLRVSPTCPQRKLYNYTYKLNF